MGTKELVKAFEYLGELRREQKAIYEAELQENADLSEAWSSLAELSETLSAQPVDAYQTDRRNFMAPNSDTVAEFKDVRERYCSPIPPLIQEAPKFGDNVSEEWAYDTEGIGVSARDGVNFEDVIFYSNFLRPPQFEGAIKNDERAQRYAGPNGEEATVLNTFQLLAVAGSDRQAIEAMEEASNTVTEKLNGNRTTFSGFLHSNGVFYAQAAALLSTPERDRAVSLRNPEAMSLG